MNCLTPASSIEDRYFDVFVEYAKESPEDILIQITVHNRGPEAAELHVLPTLWFRNQWSWARHYRPAEPCTIVGQCRSRRSHPVAGRTLSLLRRRRRRCLFTENETNTQRIFGVPNRTPYVKDSINNYIVHGQKDAVNPEQKGTKAAAHYHVTIKPGESQVIRLRLSDRRPDGVRSGQRPRRPRRSAAPSTDTLEAPAQGGRRILRHRHPAFAQRRPGQRHAPGPGGHALEQAVLSLRRGQVARRARLRSVQGDSQAGAAQRPLAPHVQRRHHLHARQVGVSLVRGVGPRLPRHCSDARRSAISARSN